jgi:ketosteroid isomerase-like protein
MDVRELIDRYNDAWNRHDVDAICAMHTDDMVFHNHTAGERVEGEAVRAHIARIFENTPSLRFTGRALHVGDDFAVSEWTAHAERDGRRVEWDGVDVFPLRDGKIARKDVYSAAHRPRDAADPPPRS